MADRFYVGVEVVKVPTSAWFAMFSCTMDKKAKPVYVRLPERGQVIGATFWLNKPKCPIHKVSTCLDAGVAVQLQAQEAIKQTLRYDDSFMLPPGS
jgi:hypothetical protein